MNDVDRMKIELAAAISRVRKLEILFETRKVLNDDEREAQRIAEQLGFSVDVVVYPVRCDNAGAKSRGRIARELHARKKWKLTRIARALHCSDRTVRRAVFGR